MKYFEINKWYGTLYIELCKEFPIRMSRKRALELSIQKWETIVDHIKEYGDIVHNDGDTCALCEKYDYHLKYGACHRCPVKEKAGKPDCEDTPWKMDTNLQDAEAELEFLKEIWQDLYP